MGDFLWVFLGVVVFSVLLYLLASMVFGPGERVDSNGEQVPDRLPDDRPLTAEDVAGIKLRVVARGYQMSDVDALLDRVARELPSRGADLGRVTSAGEPVEYADPPALVDPAATGETLNADEHYTDEPAEPVDSAVPAEPVDSADRGEPAVSADRDELSGPVDRPADEASRESRE